MFSIGVKPSIRVPDYRELAVHFVEKCACHGDESGVYVRDPNEAAFLCNALGGTDRLVNFEKATNVHFTSIRMERHERRGFTSRPSSSAIPI